MAEQEKLYNIFGKAIEWIPKIYKILQPFRPEAKSFEIDYKLKEANLRLFLYIPPSVKKRIGKIEIPKYESFNIESLMDDSFNNLRSKIQINESNDSWIIKTNQLPSCENFLIMLNGNVDPKFLNRIVNVKPAINKDSTNTYEKYWLDVMIKDLSILEKMYNQLEIKNIDCVVKITIEKEFTTDMPKSLVRAINAIKDYFIAGLGTNKNEVFNTWRRLRHTSRNWDLANLEDTIKELSSKIIVKDYIKVDSPFYLGNVVNPEVEKVIPTYFTAEALSNLSLDSPTASGYLKFHKKNYQNEIKNKLGSGWDKFRKTRILNLNLN